MEKARIDIPDYILQASHGKLEIDTKEVEIVLPEYSQKKGLWRVMEEDYMISVHIDPEGSVSIKADKGGLISLARHLLTLAQDEVPDWVHLHYSGWDLLEKGSCELIIEKS